MEERPITIVAILEAEEGKRDFVRAEISKILAPTRAEEGCMAYILHEDNKNPNVFMFYETWASYDLWQKHLQSEHLQAYGKVAGPHIVKRQILELTQCKE